MDVAVVGGGPGGLYASLLLKRDHPDWTVRVYERNPPDVTYGWGIVFPARSLSSIEAADADSHAAIAETARRWEPFDLHYRGTRYRSAGHTFASLLRTDLLAILQDRSAEVGVDLVFEHAVDSPETLADDVDLLVGADGITSDTRAAFADAFGPETVDGTAWYSWFGTDADFEVLSHIFEENDDGIWCAHTYPGPVSTFIVDCDAETWRNAGLADVPEADSLGYLEAVFEDHLDGRPIRSQRDRWRRFTTVTNASWHHDNVVLVGDAAHTAHYSIGSGTTMAIEDAIALAGAYSDAGVDIVTALSAYEAERKPAAVSLQRAGERSRRHFEHIRRFADTAGLQFTLHHLTRSGRLSYASLARRDPDLVDAFDRWFAATAPGGPGDPAAVDDPADPLAQPFELRGLWLPRRPVAVCEPTYASHDGRPSSALLAAFADRTARNPGLTLTEPLAVTRDGRVTPGSPGLYADDHETAWREAVASARGSTGAHLVHAGRRGAVQPAGFALDRPLPRNESWAPRLSDQYDHPPRAYAPTAMGPDDRDRIESAFVRSTERADAAGFDYLQVHLGNGYLLGSFLSPVTNGRDDGFGDDLDGRLRFPQAVVSAVRRAWPDDKPLGVTLQTVDWVEGGLTLEDAIAAGRRLVDAGVDLLAPAAGGVSAREEPDEIYGLANYADHLRHALDVPTMATVQATTADEVNTLVATGRADLCTYYRPFDEVA